MARQLKKRRAAVVRHGDAQRSPRCRGTQGSDSERRRTARGDSYDNVVLPDVGAGNGFCAFCFVVFGTFDALQHRLHSSSHHENDTIAWPIVCRAKLGAILNSDATGSAGTDVNQATAALEGRHRVVDGGIYRRKGRFYGCTRGELPVIHRRDHVAGGPRIQIDEPRTYVLRQHSCVPLLCRRGLVEAGSSRRARSRAPATASPSGGDRKCRKSGESHRTRRSARPPSSEMRGAPNSTRERMSTPTCRALSATISS